MVVTPSSTEVAAVLNLVFIIQMHFFTVLLHMSVNFQSIQQPGSVQALPLIMDAGNRSSHAKVYQLNIRPIVDPPQAIFLRVYIVSTILYAFSYKLLFSFNFIFVTCIHTDMYNSYYSFSVFNILMYEYVTAYLSIHLFLDNQGFFFFFLMPSHLFWCFAYFLVRLFVFSLLICEYIILYFFWKLVFNTH